MRRLVRDRGSPRLRRTKLQYLDVLRHRLLGHKLLTIKLLHLLMLLGCLNPLNRLRLRAALLRHRLIVAAQVRFDSSKAQRAAPNELIAKVDCFLQLATCEALVCDGLCNFVAASAESEGRRRCLPLSRFQGR